MVGISKKSLDDYLLQLRLGRKYGFNFNQNKTKKVGILRAFVKNHRAKANKNDTGNNNYKNNNDTLEGNINLDEENDEEEENEQQGSNDSEDSEG